MNFPFNFIPHQYFNNNFQNNSENNDFNFFSNPFGGQPFFNNNNNQSDQQSFNYNNFNPFQQNNNLQPNPNNKPNPPKKNSKKSQDPAPNSKINSSEKLKNIGNDYFKAGDYPKAIEYYSKAIEKDCNQAKYYLNRAICFKYLRKYKESIRDCNTVIELDDQNYKAYLLLGRIMAETGKYENSTEKIQKALPKIEKAMQIYFNQKTEKSEKIIREIKTYFLRARKLLWYKTKELTKAQSSDIYSYIQNSLKNEAFSENKKNEIINDLEYVLPNPYKNLKNDYIVPDEFCCKITLEIMEEPYLCPSGISYEGKIIFDHLKAQNFDPVTREPLSANQVFPNRTLKMAIDNYLKKNPWAFEYTEGENYTSIEF